MPTTDYLPFILLLLLPPLAGFVINGIGFRVLPKKLAGLIGRLCCAIPFAASVMLYATFKATGELPFKISLFQWFSTSAFSIDFSFFVDQLTLVMLLMVTGIGSLIHVYSFGYMRDDEGFGKFFSFLNLFIFSMLLLVLGGNYVVMFAGWEGVGLCSFLLIGFWNKNLDYNKAARKAFVMNRIGDLGFLLGVFLLIANFGTTDFTTIFAKAPSVFSEDDPTLVLITMLLFVGAMGKSAQIPLYTWLPDAMAGPTPVSALIHAATMVTAGVYMVFRSNPLYSLAPTTLHFIGYIGAATALLGAIIGLRQNDIKKVLAYSTVSQLGYMFIALGVGSYVSSLFHVWTHAFFKALMFLGAGSVIHALHNEQDLRKMGGLRKYIPITFGTFVVGWLAICGIPPFAGFFSKDEILAAAFMHDKVLWVIGLMGSFLTAFYMTRLVALTFFGEFRGTEEQRHHLHESPLIMTAPLIILAIGSALVGFMGLPEALGGSHLFNDWLEPVTVGSDVHEMDHSTELMLMAVSVAVAVAGMAAGWVVYAVRRTVPAADIVPESGLARVVTNKFYVDEIYERVVTKPLGLLSSIFHIIVDNLMIDLFITGGAKLVQVGGRGLRFIQSGAISLYLLLMVTAMALIFLYQFYEAAGQ